MTALAADLNVTDGVDPLLSKRHATLIVDIMYRNAAFALGTPTHGTASSRGQGMPWSGVAGEFLCGRWNTGKTTGDLADTPTSTGSPTIDDEVIRNVVVAGLASSSFQADVLKFVYLGDDNIGASLTLTRPAAPNRTPFGIVYRGISATACDVLRFGLRTRLMLDLLGTNVRTVFLGAIAANLTASGDLLTGIVMSGHGKILDTYAICVKGQTDADVDIDANLEIGGTDVTGGVIELVTADVTAAKKAGTAITAANEFHDGDLLDVEGVVNTAGAVDDPGEYNLYATIEYLPGL